MTSGQSSWASSVKRLFKHKTARPVLWLTHWFKLCRLQLLHNWEVLRKWTNNTAIFGIYRKLNSSRQQIVISLSPLTGVENNNCSTFTDRLPAGDKCQSSGAFIHSIIVSLHTLGAHSGDNTLRNPLLLGLLHAIKLILFLFILYSTSSVLLENYTDKTFDFLLRRVAGVFMTNRC